MASSETNISDSLIKKRGFDVLRIVLGSFLLGAAGLKIHGLILGTITHDYFLSSLRIQILSIELELLLGFWLLSGWCVKGAWFVALGFFGVLSCISLYIAIIGHSSCGCFGRINVNPLFTFILDLVIFLLLILFHPNGMTGYRKIDFPKLNGTFGSVAFGLFLFIGVLGIIIGIFSVWFGSVEEATAYFRGDSISIQPQIVYLGRESEGSVQDGMITITNWSNEPIRVIGVSLPCNCALADKLPITIPSKEGSRFQIRYYFVGNPGLFTKNAIIYVETKHRRIEGLQLTLQGQLVD